MKLFSVIIIELSYILLFSNALLHDSDNLLNEIKLSSPLKLRNTCTCGVFLDGNDDLLSSEGMPLFTNEINMPWNICSELGKRFCTNKCTQMVIQNMANIGPLICSSTNNDVFRERLRLYIKTCDKNWSDTGFTPAKEYCCTNGEETKCSLSNSILGASSSPFSNLLDLVSPSESRSIPNLLFDLVDRTAELASDLLGMAEENLS